MHFGDDSCSVTALLHPGAAGIESCRTPPPAAGGGLKASRTTGSSGGVGSAAGESGIGVSPVTLGIAVAKQERRLNEVD